MKGVMGMMVVKLVITVFDALLMFMVGMVAATATDKKSVGLSIFLIVIMVINLLCIWG